MKLLFSTVTHFHFAGLSHPESSLAQSYGPTTIRIGMLTVSAIFAVAAVFYSICNKMIRTTSCMTMHYQLYLAAPISRTKYINPAAIHSVIPVWSTTPRRRLPQAAIYQPNGFGRR